MPLRGRRPGRWSPGRAVPGAGRRRPASSCGWRRAGADGDNLVQIAAEVLGEVYFRDNGRRAHGLDVELKALVDLEFEL
ncbi:hypothetical protein AB0M19_34620 [Streptomyces sp. NPDC051920]|uniref:hypothetical protein n=1 Tax=Streptomyces sp. NPDC051920 TaxID=3155523 RepID=UPI00343A5232